MLDKSLETKALLKLLDQARSMIAGEGSEELDGLDETTSMEKPIWDAAGKGSMQAPDASPAHEAAETPEVELQEHETGEEAPDESDPMTAIRAEQKKTQAGYQMPQKNAVMAAMSVKLPRRK